jgi:hypothetical protein
VACGWWLDVCSECMGPMKSVSGHAAPGQLMALMGGSGAGDGELVAYGFVCAQEYLQERC